ncbi:hypothetical protein Vretimale_582 [Volvox reticuliferus]|uniref:Uncharacterized protein n=1 Tax=Volvox reticuliferus TaxID=1737510 RepID=A0A8J4FYI2_9CHLO|nr:hypothetical protein Vretifemale_2412 [Volvox reticuliferus]GIL94352.1 hypothetical protein Vretimale_582 [Volvox reticuliferus]
MARPRAGLIELLILVCLLALKVDAGSLKCTAFLYLKGNYGGESLQLSLAPVGETDKNVLLDLAALPTPSTYRSWDDALNSARFLCNCTSGNCNEDYSKLTLRLFAEPYWRKNGGGDKIDVNCTSVAGAPSCIGSQQYMPKGWGSRASAVAILYNLPNYVLPKKAPSPDAGTTPSTPSPAPGNGTQANPSPPAAKPPIASPPPKPSPKPSPSPPPKPSPRPSPKPSPRPSPKPSPKPSPRTLLKA